MKKRPELEAQHRTARRDCAGVRGLQKVRGGEGVKIPDPLLCPHLVSVPNTPQPIPVEAYLPTIPVA